MNCLKRYLLEYDEPTEDQKKAGNYKKEHRKWQGFDVSIENPAGSYRSGKDKDGKEWKQKMYYDYGYLRGTEGKDGDHVDVFFGPNEDSNTVYIVNQIDQKTGKFDEHKCMLQFDSLENAKKAYLKNYEDGWKCGQITIMSIDDFKKWIKDNDGKVTDVAKLEECKMNILKKYLLEDKYEDGINYWSNQPDSPQKRADLDRLKKQKSQQKRIPHRGEEEAKFEDLPPKKNDKNDNTKNNVHKGIAVGFGVLGGGLAAKHLYNRYNKNKKSISGRIKKLFGRKRTLRSRVKKLFKK